MGTCDSCLAGGEPIYAGEALHWCEACGNGFCNNCVELGELDDDSSICISCREKHDTIQAKMHKEGVTSQDIHETMPPDRPLS